MQIHHISIEKTKYFSKLFLDYINQNENIRNFYKYSPALDSFETAIKDISSEKFNRKLLVNVITEQYSKIPNSKRPTQNLQLLLSENSFTVCTGHQLCLFMGPLYFIYKIISTINLAEKLKKKFSSCNFVPVYWMVSEDHDFEEVNHLHLFGKKIEWKNKQGGAVGRYTNHGIAEVIEELKTIFGKSKNAEELINLFENAYTNHTDFSSATRYLVNELFGQYGLVIIDANDKRLKNEMKEIFSDEIENQTSFKLVSKTIQELSKLGYKAQVNPRGINLFLLQEGERIRIDEKVLAKVLPNGADLEGASFSPNVVTRTLYQQKILPNLAYIGGQAEISYWLEYKEMFEQYGIFFPVLMPRNFVTLIDENVSARMRKSVISNQDIFLTVNEMIDKYIASVSGEKISLSPDKENLQKLYNEISVKLSLVDETLVASAESALQSHLKSLDHIEKKLLRAFKYKNETITRQVEKIKEQLFPNGELQERYENFIPFYLKYGKSFIDNLKQCMNPLDFSFLILSVE